VMDGLEATQIIRARGYQGPIVALSANAMEKDRQLSLQAGCVGHLTKPINRRKLLQTVADLCLETAGPAATSS
jgi:CheY-like chemotaxis protein